MLLRNSLIVAGGAALLAAGTWLQGDEPLLDPAALDATIDRLLDDPSLRQGLVNLWAAEAESAGLQIASLHCIGTGVRDSSEGYALAELSSGGEQYVLRATRCIKQYDAIVVHADRSAVRAIVRAVTQVRDRFV